MWLLLFLYDIRWSLYTDFFLEGSFGLLMYCRGYFYCINPVTEVFTHTYTKHENFKHFIFRISLYTILIL